mmetsp:Transcript_23133/g.22604  ORF Transcript_23133/g.22604 Transcript_23133/m.22604 type:complete len:96 (+) Transcript_23133:559-846(+)
MFVLGVMTFFWSEEFKAFCILELGGVLDLSLGSITLFGGTPFGVVTLVFRGFVFLTPGFAPTGAGVFTFFSSSLSFLSISIRANLRVTTSASFSF